jgi:hypothetical protein
MHNATPSASARTAEILRVTGVTDVLVKLGLDGNGQALRIGLDLALEHAKASVTGGRTKVIFCKPELAALLENNSKFIEALCEEGVVEWLTPFVLTKSKQSTTDTNQP